MLGDPHLAPPGDTPGRPAPSRPERRWLGALISGGPFLALGLVLLLMWAGVIWFSTLYPKRLVADHERDLAAAAHTAARLAEGVLRDAESNMRTIDLWLLTREVHQPLDDSALALLADTLRDSSRGLVDVLLGTSDGKFYRLPNHSGQPFTDLRGAEFVQLLRQPGDEDLVLGAPLQLRQGGGPQLPMAMRMSGARGELSLLLAVIDLRKLGQLLQPYARGEDGAVALLRSNGIGLVRVPDLPGFAGRDLFAGHEQRRPLLRQLRGVFPSNGATVDGRPRIVAYETLGAFNFKLTVAQGRYAPLRQHDEQRRLLLLICGGITAAALLITLALGRVQRHVREREAALLATSNATPLGLFRSDRSGALSFANETYLTLHGLPRERQAWGWLDLLPEADRERERSLWQQQVAAGQPVNMVRSVRRPDGQLRHFAVRTAPLKVDERVIGAAGTVDDVTERLLQQQAQLTLHAIFDQTPDYICQFDPQGQLIYLNPAGRARLGLASDAALADWHYQRLLPVTVVGDFIANLPPQALSDGHWHGQTLLNDPAGQAVPVACTVLIHRDPQGQVQTVSVLLRDISAHVDALRERERIELVLGAVSEAVSAMIAVLDREQRLILCNRAFEQQFGLAREALLGRHLSELLGEQEYAHTQPLLQAALQGQIAHRELHLNGRIGPQVLELEYAPLRHADGQIEGLVWLARDISALKAEEARLRDASRTDPLTRLLNRAGFEQRCDEQMALARQHDSLICLLYLDLDHFKPVNDQFGHPVGDALLRAVAGRLRHTLRSQDLVGRLGGDEFAVLLPNLQQHEVADRVATKLVHAVAQPFRIEQHEITVGVSIGFCVARGSGTDLSALVAQADSRLYEAKRAGRGVFRGGFRG